MAGTILVVQETLTLAARLLKGVVTEPMIGATTATVRCRGFRLVLLELKEVRVANMLLALLIALLLVATVFIRGVGSCSSRLPILVVLASV